MLHVKRNNSPDLLNDNQTDWTQPWIDHYRWKPGKNPTAQPPKPRTSHWLKRRIRLPLIDCFNNNCGYCGDSIPTPKVNGQSVDTSKGDVDHFLPKSLFPEKVYAWENYVWSCKPCNQLKREFYSQTNPLFDPCDKEDCEHLICVEDTGQYTLKSTVINDPYWQKRIKNSEERTLLNSDEITHKRKAKILTLRSNFKSIDTYISLLQIPIQDQDQAKTINKELETLIQDSITEIRQVIASPDFTLLIKEIYQVLLKEFPQVSEIL